MAEINLTCVLLDDDRYDIPLTKHTLNVKVSHSQTGQSGACQACDVDVSLTNYPM